MPSIRPFTTLVSALGLLFFASCGEQGEGERCERSNDNNDCAPGLVCKSLQNLTGVSEGAVCCPESNNFTTDICRPQSFDLNTGDDVEPAPAAPATPTMEDAGG